MNENIPKITIVTVVYNGVDCIENTLKSVICQDYTNIEYIIVDGQSTDKTMEIVKKYQNLYPFIRWVSEKDQGVYDAMNKGIALASGEWINFMNVGDSFYSSNILSSIFNTNQIFDDYDVIYGDTEFRLKNIGYIVEASDSVDTNQYMPFSHQASFTRTSIAKNYSFDLQYKIAADTAFFLCLTINSHKMLRVPIIVCSYNALDGLSADNDYRRSLEIVNLQARWNHIDVNDQHFKDYLKQAKRQSMLKKIIPKIFWDYLRENKTKTRYQTYPLKK